MFNSTENVEEPENTYRSFTPRMALINRFG